MKAALKVVKTLAKNNLSPEMAETLILMHKNPKANKAKLATMLGGGREPLSANTLGARLTHLADGRKPRAGLNLIKLADGRNIDKANAAGFVITAAGNRVLKKLEGLAS